MGKPLAECKWDVDDVAYCFEYYAGKAAELDSRQGVPVPLPDSDYRCELRYDAVGVAACIVPWNYPLLSAPRRARRGRHRLHRLHRRRAACPLA
jgi:betaine-aldehyde dehydrogenase